MFKTHKPIYFILAILFTVGVAVGLLFSIQNFKTDEEMLSISNFPSPRNGEGGGGVEKSVTDDTANWQTYRNEEFGFEIKYPKTFLNCENCQMFQIVINNYVVIEKGPGEFYSELAKNLWQQRLSNKDLYKIGDKCLDEDFGDFSVKNCEIFSLDPYVFKLTEKLGDGSKFSEHTVLKILSLNFDFSLKLPKIVDDKILKEILSTVKIFKPNQSETELVCSKYKYSSCPKICKKLCVPSSCGENGVCTADCEGEGSCVNLY